MHARQASILETLRAVQTDDVRLAHMKPIAEVAKARLRAVPEMHAFALPVATPSSTRLVALAGAMGDAAVKHEAVFVDAGLPEDFIARLNTAAAVLRDSLSAARRASAERSVRRPHSPRSRSRAEPYCASSTRWSHRSCGSTTACSANGAA